MSELSRSADGSKHPPSNLLVVMACCEWAKDRVGHNHADKNAAEQHQHHRQSCLPRLLAERMSGPFI